MTQDQYGQTRAPGYVRDDAVPDDENEEYADGQAKPMTRFQKVASALRGAPEPDEQDQTAADQVTAADQSGRAQTGMADSPASREANPQGDYWDEPVASAADRDEAVAVTSPDAAVTETGTNPLARQDQLSPGRSARTRRITRRLSRTCSAPPRTRATGPRHRLRPTRPSPTSRPRPPASRVPAGGVLASGDQAAAFRRVRPDGPGRPG